MRGGYCCGVSSLLCFPPPGLPLLLSVSPHTWPSSTIMLTWSSSPINPLHKPLDSLLSAPDRTMHYRDNYTCLALVLLATSLSYSSLSCCFWTTSNFSSSACSYPDHSLQLAHLALSPAPSSTTCYPPCSINPFLSLQHRLCLLLGSASSTITLCLALSACSTWEIFGFTTLASKRTSEDKSSILSPRTRTLSTASVSSTRLFSTSSAKQTSERINNLLHW